MTKRHRTSSAHQDPFSQWGGIRMTGEVTNRLKALGRHRAGDENVLVEAVQWMIQTIAQGLQSDNLYILPGEISGLAISYLAVKLPNGEMSPPLAILPLGLPEVIQLPFTDDFGEPFESLANRLQEEE